MMNTENYDWLFVKFGSNPGGVRVCFGEVWKVKNSAWKKIKELRSLSRVIGWHPGLCIRSSDRQMAFGTSKKKSDLRKVYVVSNIFKDEKTSYFLLNYSLPVTLGDLVMQEPTMLENDKLKGLKLKLRANNYEQ